jgi:Flp pilus assembly protein TadD
VSNRIWREQLALTLLAAGDGTGFEKVQASFEQNPGASREAAHAALAGVRLAVLKPQPESRAAELITVAERLVSSHPDRALARSALGVACFRAGRFQDALEHLKEAIQLHGRGGEPETLFFLAMAWQGSGEPDKARAAFDRGTALVERGQVEKGRPSWDVRLRWRLLQQEAGATLKK